MPPSSLLWWHFVSAAVVLGSFSIVTGKKNQDVDLIEQSVNGLRKATS